MDCNGQHSWNHIYMVLQKFITNCPSVNQGINASTKRNYAINWQLALSAGEWSEMLYLIPKQLKCRDVACPVYGEKEKSRCRFTDVMHREVRWHRRRHRQVEYKVCISQHWTWQHQRSKCNNRTGPMTTDKIPTADKTKWTVRYVHK